MAQARALVMVALVAYLGSTAFLAPSSGAKQPSLQLRGTERAVEAGLPAAAGVEAPAAGVRPLLAFGAALGLAVALVSQPALADPPKGSLLTRGNHLNESTFVPDIKMGGSLASLEIKVAPMTPVEKKDLGDYDASAKVAAKEEKKA